LFDFTELKFCCLLLHFCVSICVLPLQIAAGVVSVKMTETETFGSALLEAIVPRWLSDFRRKTPSKTEQEALSDYQSRIDAQQVCSLQ
jgi:hypothetical protein